MAAHNELGTWGEEMAVRFLERKGYTILERDWKSGHRDIDIIATDGEIIVFVEVKTRRNRMFGEPEEAIDYQKLRNLRVAINHFVKYKCINQEIRLDAITVVGINQEIRLDAITVVGTPDSGEPEITHIQDFPIY